MSLEVEDRPSVEPTKQLKRQDSLYGDAEKVSSAKYHGSEVRFPGNLITMLQRCIVIDKVLTAINLMVHREAGHGCCSLRFRALASSMGMLGRRHSMRYPAPSLMASRTVMTSSVSSP